MPGPPSLHGFGETPVGAFHGPIAAAAEAIADRGLSAPGPVHVVEISLVDRVSRPRPRCKPVRLAASHIEGVDRGIPRRAATVAAAADVAAGIAVAGVLDIAARGQHVAARRRADRRAGLVQHRRDRRAFRGRLRHVAGRAVAGCCRRAGAMSGPSRRPQPHTTCGWPRPARKNPAEHTAPRESDPGSHRSPIAPVRRLPSNRPTRKIVPCASRSCSASFPKGSSSNPLVQLSRIGSSRGLSGIRSIHASPGYFLICRRINRCLRRDAHRPSVAIVEASRQIRKKPALQAVNAVRKDRKNGSPPGRRKP